MKMENIWNDIGNCNIFSTLNSRTDCVVKMYKCVPALYTL